MNKLKIGILGAPNVGKTDFAYQLERALVDRGFPMAIVIDHYVDDLRESTMLAYGHFGNHIDDIQVAFKRREQELINRSQGTITCGTILDTTAHCFIRTEEPARNTRELTLTQERLRTIAGVFGLLYTDTWDYDYAFYLPYTGTNVKSQLVDKALVELIREYAPPVMSFKPEVKNEEKARVAAEAIHAIETEQLPEAEERGVRASGEAGEDDGDSSRPVSDVSE